MIIAQMCLRLATIKGHTQTCSFVLLGGALGTQKTSRCLVTMVFLMQGNTPPWHRADESVCCGVLVPSSSMAVWSCWIQDLPGTPYTPIQSVPNMFDG